MSPRFGLSHDTGMSNPLVIGPGREADVSSISWTAAPASNNDFVFGGTLRLNANNDIAALTMNTLTFSSIHCHRHP